MMPGLDGFETLRSIKTDPGLCEVPVLMISAVDETDSVVRCLQLGAEDYLPKPFEPAVLQARVGACLERSGCATAKGSISKRSARSAIGPSGCCSTCCRAP